MVMKSQTKITMRLFSKHKTRLITILSIVIISIGFMFGILEVENKINVATNNLYESQNISDLYFKSKNQTGFTKEEIKKIRDKFPNDNILESFCYEEEINNEIIRFYYYDLTSSVNALEIKEGNLPQNENEVLVERKTSMIKSGKVGDVIKIQGKDYKISGIVVNPLIIIETEEPSFINPNEHIDRVIYFNATQPPMVNDIYVSFQNRDLFNSYSSKYEKNINTIKNELKIELGNDVKILTLYENYGLYSLNSYAEKVSMIGIIFVVFFSLITLLVVYSTMSRLLDEERGQIACQKTLGYSNLNIIRKYLNFVAVGIVGGGILSFGIGLGLTYIIYSAFGIQYLMPKMPSGFNLLNYLFVFGLILVTTLILMFITAIKVVDQKPAVLLVPKAPKKGKKVLIEKIPFIWNRLSFKYKSTIRNVFLFKSRFFMTVISIIGSTVLVFAGMGLLDCTINMENAETLFAISIVLIIFSACLCALVIYNITNINVSERTREIATLMVLGYHDKEVSSYIYREIYIMSCIGAILGIPFGYLFIDFVFYLIDFGSISDINWWTWILAPLITIIFSVLATMLLYKKIVKTDMNASLKILE